MSGYLNSIFKEYTASYTGLPKACWSGIVLTFVEAVAVGICFFLSIYFVDTLHIDITKAGFLISCYGLGTVVGGIVGGKLSDQIPPRYISMVSLFIQSAAFFFLIELKTVEMLMVNLFILGVAAYCFKTSNNVWILSQCQFESQLKLKTMGISHVASNLGLGISGIIIGIVAGYGFQYIFYLSSFILFLSAIFLLVSQQKHKNIFQVEVCEKNNVLKQNKLNKKILLLMLGCVFLIGLIISQLSATYPIYVQNAFPKLGINAVSILYVLDTVLIVFFQAPLISLIGNYNKILIVGIGAFLMGLGMLVLSFSFIFTLAIISCIIWTTGEMLFLSTAQLVCYERGGEKKKGQTLGVFQSAYAASNVIGPSVGGAIYQYGGGDLLWYLSMIIGLLCLSACVFYMKYD